MGLITWTKSLFAVKSIPTEEIDLPKTNGEQLPLLASMAKDAVGPTGGYGDDLLGFQLLPAGWIDDNGSSGCRDYSKTLCFDVDGTAIAIQIYNGTKEIISTPVRENEYISIRLVRDCTKYEMDNYPNGTLFDDMYFDFEEYSYSGTKCDNLMWLNQNYKSKFTSDGTDLNKLKGGLTIHKNYYIEDMKPPYNGNDFDNDYGLHYLITKEMADNIDILTNRDWRIPNLADYTNLFAVASNLSNFPSVALRSTRQVWRPGLWPSSVGIKPKNNGIIQYDCIGNPPVIDTSFEDSKSKNAICTNAVAVELRKYMNIENDYDVNGTWMFNKIPFIKADLMDKMDQGNQIPSKWYVDDSIERHDRNSIWEFRDISIPYPDCRENPFWDNATALTAGTNLTGLGFTPGGTYNSSHYNYTGFGVINRTWISGDKPNCLVLQSTNANCIYQDGSYSYCGIRMARRATVGELRSEQTTFKNIIKDAENRWYDAVLINGYWVTTKNWRSRTLYGSVSPLDYMYVKLPSSDLTGLTDVESEEAYGYCYPSDVVGQFLIDPTETVWGSIPKSVVDWIITNYPGKSGCVMKIDRNSPSIGTRIVNCAVLKDDAKLFGEVVHTFSAIDYAPISGVGLDNALKSRNYNETVRCFPKCKASDFYYFASDCTIVKFTVTFYDAFGQSMKVAAPFKLRYSQSSGFGGTYPIPSSDGSVSSKSWDVNIRSLRGDSIYFYEDTCDYATLCPGGFTITMAVKPL